MVTLANIVGSSLVPDLPGAFRAGGQAFLAGEELDARALAEEQAVTKQIQTGELLGQLEQPDLPISERTAILSRLAAINLPLSKQVVEIIEKGSDAENAELAEVSEQAIQFTTSALERDDSGIRLAVTDEIKKRIAAGGPFPQKLFDISVKNSPGEIRVALRQMQVASTDSKTLTDANIAERKRQAIRRETLADQEQFEIVDIPGVGKVQRNKLTQELSAVPAQAVPKAPQTRTITRGEETVTQQFNPSTGAFEEVARGPRFQEKLVTDTPLIKNLKAIGIDPTTPEGAALVKQAITKPATKIDINQANDGLFKLPQGFMLLDQNDPTKGVTPIPGGPKDTVSGENAAKTQMLQTAKRAAKGVRELVFDKEGNLDTVNLIAASINAPGTDGRKLRSRMEFGIQAITRLETGAAMPDSEVDNTRTRFMPAPLDSPEIAKLKLDMFDDFLDGTLKLLDPSGRFQADRFQSELDKRSGESGEKPNRRSTDGLTPEEQKELKQLRKRFGK